jgi:hypothetical protein
VLIGGAAQLQSKGAFAIFALPATTKMTAATIFCCVGTLLAILGYGWLVAIAFRQGTAWGVTLLLFFPLAGCIYLSTESKKKAGPFSLLLSGGLLSGIAMALLDF